MWFGEASHGTERVPVRDSSHIKWKMVSGTLERYEGAAWIQPWGANRCLVTYEMLAVPPIPAPNAVMAHGLRTAAAAVIGAVRKRVTVLAASRQPAEG